MIGKRNAAAKSCHYERCVAEVAEIARTHLVTFVLLHAVEEDEEEDVDEQIS